MEKLNGKNILILLLTLLFTACQSYKKVPYLQDAEVVLYSTQDAQLYDAKIMPKDLLTIVVSCTSPELAAPFNLTVATQGNMALNYTTTQPALQQYLVDNEGNINFPVLGELHVGGLTKKATEQMIVEKLKPYITETPIVTVRMVNYKISVIGEVARPGTFTISNEKVNILEALAMAGDMTVYGCLLYTSDAADDMQCVDLGGRRIIKKTFFQAEDGIRDSSTSRGLGDVYKRQSRYIHDLQ